jgi:hypothetical protein
VDTWDPHIKARIQNEVLWNSVLRRIFGNTREEMRRLEKLYNEEIHNLYSSPDIIRVIKSRRLRWMEHVAYKREIRNAYSFSHNS